MIKLKAEIFYKGFLEAFESLRFKEGKTGEKTIREWPGSTSLWIKKWNRELTKELKPIEETRAEIVERLEPKFDDIPEDWDKQKKAEEIARQKKERDAFFENNEEFKKEIEELFSQEIEIDLKKIVLNFTAWEEAGRYYDISAAALEVLEDILEIK